MTSHRIHRWRASLLFALATLLPFGVALAAGFTVVNNCGYTVYPESFPPLTPMAGGPWRRAPR